MTESTYVFAFIGSKGCPACMHFRQNSWTASKKDLEKIPGVKVIEHETPNLGSPLPETLPKGLGNYVQWYPTFILAKKEEWDAGKITQATVFNGQELNGKWVPAKATDKVRPRESASLVAWVKEMIGGNFFTKKGPSFSSLHQGKGQVKPNTPKAELSKDSDIYTPTYCQMGFRPLF